METANDLGGRDGLGAPEVEIDEPVFHAPWERTARALVYAAMRRSRTRRRRRSGTRSSGWTPSTT